MLLRIFVFLVISLPPVASAQTDAARLREIDTALTLTGVDAALRQLEVAYRYSLSVGKADYQIDPTRLQSLERALSLFSAAAIQDKLRDRLLSQYQQRPLQAVLGMQKNKIVEKFRSFETVASSPKQREKMEQYLATMDEHPFTETRLGLLRSLNKATHSVPLMALVKAHADVDTAVALDLVSGENISRNDGQGVLLWRSKLEQGYLQRFDQLGEGYQIFAYRWINNNDVRQYLQLWQDKNVQWFMEAVLSSLRQVLQEQHDAMVASLAQ